MVSGMRLAFGDCVFDSGTREVSRGGRTLELSPKAFALLDILISHRPNAVSKEEIHERLWPGTFVSDASVANQIAELREALGDDARKPKIIRTVHRFGYAFFAAAAARPPASTRACPYRLIWGDREIALASGENLLGREESAVVWIDAASVSRRHARITVDGSKAVLEDLGSRNGTRLRGEKIQSPTELADGDLITIGPASFVLRVLHHTASTASAIEEKSEP